MAAERARRLGASCGWSEPGGVHARDRLFWDATYKLREAEALAGLGSRVVGARPPTHLGASKAKRKPPTHLGSPKHAPHVVRDAGEPDPADAPPTHGEEESWAQAWTRRARKAVRTAQDWAASGNDTLRERAGKVGAAIASGARSVARGLARAGTAAADLTIGGLHGVEDAAKKLVVSGVEAALLLAFLVYQGGKAGARAAGNVNFAELAAAAVALGII